MTHPETNPPVEQRHRELATPRTDALNGVLMTRYDSDDFARELERELTAANADAEALAGAMVGVLSYISCHLQNIQMENRLAKTKGLPPEWADETEAAIIKDYKAVETALSAHQARMKP